MAQVILKGQEPPREDKYNISSKGLFVFASAGDVRFTYTTQTEKEVDCSIRFEHYHDEFEKSCKLLKGTFQLDGEPDNLLTSTLFDTETDTVKDLVEDILEKRKLINPSFLMVFLMAPSFEFGQFLMGRARGSSGASCCPTPNHICKEKCHSRRVSNLLRSIAEAHDENGDLIGLPKIFFIQTISGSERVYVTKDKMGDDDKPEICADDYTPKGSDTFILYVHTEQTMEWLIKTNKHFYLITFLCETIKAMRQKITECNKMLKMMSSVFSDKPQNKRDQIGSVSTTTPPIAAKKMAKVDEDMLRSIAEQARDKLDIDLELNLNSFIDGWLDNLCTTTAANITAWLKEEEINSSQVKGTGQNPVCYDHMRVYISSTMRRRLSMYDILRQQFP
ncbi:uncharacterized protein [Watersipora subatra]|uniref:uncharacterized protein n=1 Tax=Watersipora subatra TaxID=2589382 RepID=UPI00355C3A6B